MCEHRQEYSIHREDEASDMRGYFLAGRQLYPGQAIDILSPVGWLPGRFDLSGDEAVFCMAMPRVAGVGGFAAGSVGVRVEIRASPELVFRWAAEEREGRCLQLAESVPKVPLWGHCERCDRPVPPGLRACIHGCS